jgi:hypothetical protein
VGTEPQPQVLAVTIVQTRSPETGVAYRCETYDVTGLEPVHVEKPNVREMAVGQAEGFVTVAQYRRDDAR